MNITKSELSNELELLKQRYVPDTITGRLYGITLSDENAINPFLAWVRFAYSKSEPITSEGIDRYAFETYLQKNELLTTKIAAVKLGMEETSFGELFKYLIEKGLSISGNNAGDQKLMPEQFIKGLPYILKSMGKFFADHNDYCRRLHEAIKIEFGVVIKPAYCVTSEIRGECPKDYAYAYDCITGEPIGLRYQVWLDLNKPMNLRPDACSLELFLNNKDILNEYGFPGQIPETPTGPTKR